MSVKTSTFTSTISPELIQWVDARARSEKRTRRAVLEDALKQYQRETAKAHLRAGFAKAAKDPDMIELAEWGMGDYLDITKRS